MIITPQLPPKAGYVEVEVNGYRTYKNVKTDILIEDEIASIDLIQPHPEFFDYTGTGTDSITITFTSKPLYITINNNLISSAFYQLNGNEVIINSIDYNVFGIMYQVFAMCE